MLEKISKTSVEPRSFYLVSATTITIPRELSKIDEKIMNGSDNEPFGNGELRYRIVRGQKGVKLRINM